MAKLILTINVPDTQFNYSHYPSDCKSAKDCIQFDIDQVDQNEISHTELIDSYLDSGATIESFKAES